MANHKPPQVPPNNTGKTYTRNVYDPRVDIFKQFYLSPTSPTFMNILRSALRAGYSEQYSNNISTQKPKWWVDLTENVEYKRAQSLKQAENNLYETVSEPLSEDINTKKIQIDVSKYVTERLGKDIYSARKELTDAGGRRLFGDEKRDSANVALGSLFKGVKEEEKA